MTRFRAAWMVWVKRNAGSRLAPSRGTVPTAPGSAPGRAPGRAFTCRCCEWSRQQGVAVGKAGEAVRRTAAGCRSSSTRSAMWSACISRRPGMGRSAPVLPMMPGMPERRTHDYGRGGVHAVRRAAHRHRRGDRPDPPPPPCRGVQEVPRPHRQGGTRRPGRAPGLRQRLDAQDPCHPAVADRTLSFHVHFTPTSSSWLNQVERWFALLTTDKQIRRGVHKNVQAH